MKIRCASCSWSTGPREVIYNCPQCGSVLEVVYERGEIGQAKIEGRGVWRYRELLPVRDRHPVTLGEGDTGLHPCPRLAQRACVQLLFVKNEGENPTGSFKDRGMTVGVTLARSLGMKVVACASTGNTSASMAAYAARAGMKALVLLPHGKVARGKVAQAVAAGARVVQVRGNFDAAMRLVRDFSEKNRSVYLLNSLNPFRLEGQKTLAFEVIESLGRAPDFVVLPMGNAGNISAIWKGFREWAQMRGLRRLPRMIGVQAAGAAPLVRAIQGFPYRVIPKPETVATAIRIGDPVNRAKAVRAIRDSGGMAVMVTDKAILSAQRRLAGEEGLFVEPAGAAPIAYLLRRELPARATVVCVATGHGLKDPDIVTEKVSFKEIPATLAALRRVVS